MTTTDHLLLLSGDRASRDSLTSYLTRQGARVTAVPTGRHLRAALDGPTPVDLVVLDLDGPGEDGLALCRELRGGKHKAMPLLMLSARGDDVDRILGLEMGADDYLVKPFSPRELLARVRAILRRARMLPPNMRETDPAARLAFGNWRLDTVERHLVDAQDSTTGLSGAEYRLLRVFLDHPQRVLSRDQLLGMTQGRETEPFERSIDLLVSRLRQRLRDDAREPRYIKTVRSAGYVLSMAVAPCM
ncbi:winged helix-turn-helix domain-containing protein [Mitsuaria sp. GD03876]|uniref:winged helix-turn-helix domain-containing protein n=1 Tax=Mitsuaria sp. GD03876 TaxID=2975399 RepID=UPI00244B67B9|nr:winged helix-turn-helix domain-containing protein [Mitsuaria sp. GD03876]MDH0863344.1 winged helix-turn-helix domain-containing protein [Mitsuaria sp. GD03876]